MKKLMTCLTSAVLLASALAIPAQAAAAPNQNALQIALDNSPASGRVQSARAKYWSSANASAICPSSTTCFYLGTTYGIKDYTTRIKATLYLQENRNGSWVTVDSVSGDVANWKLTLSDTYYSCVSGRSYRSRLEFYAYRGVMWDFYALNSNSTIAP